MPFPQSIPMKRISTFNRVSLPLVLTHVAMIAIVAYAMVMSLPQTNYLS